MAKYNSLQHSSIVIISAHNHVVRLRRAIEDPQLADLKKLTANLPILREKIGQALYTICAFYSNTNWVEMNGASAYKEFGTYAHYVSIINVCRESLNGLY